MIWAEVHLVASIEDRRGFPQKIGFDRVPVADEEVFFHPSEDGDQWPDAIKEGLYRVHRVVWSTPRPGHKAEPRIYVVGVA